MVALFRIVELCGGSIAIDDIDIRILGLHALRSRLSIIPQDPVLFSGTLRTNLDPFNQYTDQTIWEALDRVRLGTIVRNMSAGLESEVSEGGENWSAGQRQLICICR